MKSTYKQFCPVAMAAEILGSRWNILIIRELCLGSTRFNELKKGLPKLSPTLLSRRLKELEDHGVLNKIPTSKDKKSTEYKLTQSGAELLDVIISIGTWGKRWIDQKLNLENSDVGLLMWDIRRNIQMDMFPLKQATVEFSFSDIEGKKSTWWIILDEQSPPDVGPIEPNTSVDLYVSCSVSALTEFWLGNMGLDEALKKDQIKLDGAPKLISSFRNWIGKSNFSHVKTLPQTLVA
jgi:DNA-binding HxlR family transcriptional regulator